MTEPSPPDPLSTMSRPSADSATSGALFWQATRALCIDALCIDDENSTGEAGNTGADNPADLSEAEQQVFAELLAHDVNARDAALRAVLLEDCVQAVFAAEEQAAEQGSAASGPDALATQNERAQVVRPTVLVSRSRENESAPSPAGRIVTIVAVACLLVVCVLVFHGRDAGHLPAIATHGSGHAGGTVAGETGFEASPAVRWAELALAESSTEAAGGSLAEADLLGAEATLAGHELSLPLIDPLPEDGPGGSVGMQIPEWMLAAVTVATDDSATESHDWPEILQEQQ